ncbi:hypothetical protein N657DRAFT_645393 [Parathielavia appendiculata]|uniref:Uncharacterized protein n=1 Tax=Parathielavia appendiculata TaxID=2587402 RepID=A0AAN6TZW0_9PEZI|nr:hypothetical protein N657DRAFT_645393 [Parathielavia appendiculata]
MDRHASTWKAGLLITQEPRQPFSKPTFCQVHDSASAPDFVSDPETLLVVPTPSAFQRFDQITVTTQ